MVEKKAKPDKADKLIYVIAGKETALVNAECEKLIDSLIEPSQRVTGLFNADAGRVSISQVLDELRTLPFLSNHHTMY